MRKTKPIDDGRGENGANQETDAGGPERDEGGARKRSGKRFAVEIAVTLVVAVLLAVFLQSFVVKSFVIPSSSMSPTLQVGDRILCERLTLLFRKPRRGDIVVFRYPPKSDGARNTTNLFYWPFEQIGETLHLAHRNVTPYVKRVIATEGETVELRKGKLYVDGKRIEEDYVTDDRSDYGPVTVPGGELFCLGDNRLNSRDSRYWGMVPIRSVIGRVFLVWWPLSHFGKPG